MASQAKTPVKPVTSNPTPRAPAPHYNPTPTQVPQPKASLAAPNSTATTADDPGYAALIKQYLTQWGLASLIPVVTALGKDSSNTSDTVMLKLQQTKEWHARFAGNDIREKNGLGVLDPAQYIALESSYKQTLRSFGIPDGFYDSKDSTDKWIGGDVSAAEVAARAQTASDIVYNSPPEAMQAWNQFYGGGSGGAIAAILDPSAAEPLVAQKALAAEIGGSALHAGLSTNITDATRFAREGVTLDTARKAFSDIATRLSTDKALAGRYGQTFGQTEEQKATLEGDASATATQNELYASEQAQFGGRGGGTTGSANQGSNY